jgi:hypothetical protein
MRSTARVSLLVLLPCAGLAATSSAQDETVPVQDVRSWTIMVEDAEFEVWPATPTYLGDTGLFHLPSADTLPRGKVSFSVFRDNLDRDPKDEDISIHGFTFAYGATSRLEVFAGIGLQHRIDADALFQPGFVNDFPFVATPWQTGVGDVRLGAKLNLLDDDRGEPVGVALRAFVKLPTADEEKGLGTGKLSTGADLVLSRSVAHVAKIHASAGFVANADPDGVDLGNAFRYGAGVAIGPSWFQLQAELLGASYGAADFEQTDPLDLVVGPVLILKPGIFIRPALSWNLNFNDRGLDSGTRSALGRQISIGYHPGKAARRIELAAPAPPPRPAANRPPTATCAPEKGTIAPGESVGFVATASDPDGDTLAYSWSASAGRLSGGGARVVLDTTGVSVPAINVTLRASDGRGAVAESVCSVALQAPARAVEAVTCISGGFPRNLARLTNVDKACLDDVAARLRRDPRSRVTIVGHADAGERNPELIARMRAEAAKDYLVRERGIDAARVSVRGAAATQPLDRGTSAAARARNRRVEVVFVPADGNVR